MVDDALHAQLDDNTLLPDRIVDGMPGKASLHVVVLRVAVQ